MKEKIRSIIALPFKAAGIDGIIESFSFWNLYSGKSSAGDKIMDFIMPKKGPVRFPVPFALGFALENIAEASFLGYGVYEASKGNYEPLLFNAGIKTIPRFVDISLSLFFHKYR